MNSEFDESIAQFAKDVPGAALFYTLRSDGQESIRVINDYAHDIWGVTAEVIEQDPMAIWDMTHAADLENMQASVTTSARELSPWEMRWRIFDHHGRKKWLFGRGTPTAQEDGSIRWLTFVFDVTARVEAEAEAARVADHLAVALDAIPDGFALFDEKERLVTCNSALKQVYTKSRTAYVKGATFEATLRAGLKSGEFDLPEEAHETWLRERLRNFRHAAIVSEVKLSSGTWLRVLERPTRNGGRVAFSIDITKSKRQHFHLKNAATTDALTGLMNRKGFREKLQTFEVAFDEQTACAAFISIDLDKFKVVNDSYGEEAGDYLLTTIGQKLAKLNSENGLVARIGGDEFMIFVPSARGCTEIYNYAERVRSAITLPCKYKGRICQIGASVGVSIWKSSQNMALEQALLDADTALSQAKSTGRNRCLLFQESMRNQALRTAQLASQLKSSLKEDRFIPHFQPQVIWPGDQLHGIEAFARCAMPDGRFASASEFVQVSEEAGIIVELDRQIARKSMAALRALRDKNLCTVNLGLNLSETLLRMPDTARFLTDLAQENHLSPEHVFIKIMETKLSKGECNGLTNSIQSLSEAGFKIELGDFGTGPTALTHLHQLQIDRIKIDRSLTKTLASDAAMRAISEGIYSLCQRLGIDTIAEGIECEEELNAAQKIGFSVFQGYYFSRPVQYTSLIDWLETNNSPATGIIDGLDQHNRNWSRNQG